MLGISYFEHKTNDYIWQQVNVFAVIRSSYLQPPNVASYRSSAMYDDTMRCRKPYLIHFEGVGRRGKPHESWMANSKEWTGRSLQSLLLSASPIISRTWQHVNFRHG